MQISSRLLLRTAIVFLGVILCLGLVLSYGLMDREAKALTGSQWETVRSYINSYYGGSQYNSGLNGEAGFRMGKVALWNRLDSNGDISPNAGAGVGSTGTTVTGVLGEGDDAANRPVLIDNLMGQTAYIPGTEFRCNWNTDQSCFSDSSLTAIRQIVDNHKAAGFSTDIVDHCVSSQTAGPSTGGFGIIAQVPGALSSDTSLIPNVYIADYSRNGWRNSLSNAPGTSTLTAPEASAGGFSAPSGVPPASCESAATDYDLVRCQVNWAISSTGGNVGNGQTNLTTIGGAGQSVDIRNGTINTMASTGTNLQVPINTLFSTSGLANLDPTKSTVLASRTQMGATAAIGLKALGYNLIAGGAINGGIHRWNGSEGEQQVAYGDGLPLQSAPALANGPGVVVDSTAPTVTVAPSASNVTSSSADISRTAAEPATMKVEYGTTSGVYTNTVNNTVLNAVKTVGLSGLSPSTTYYVKVTSYDGQANGAVSSEISFTTAAPPCTPAKPSLSLGAPSSYWASYADYTARLLSADWTISNIGANDASNVQLTGSTPNGAVTLATTMPVAAGTIAAGNSSVVTVQYNVPMGYGGFHVWNTASAEDCSATTYTYPV